MSAQMPITGIKALFSCRCTNISHFLMALPGVNVFLCAMLAGISSVFLMTICVGNRTPFGRLLILASEGENIVNMQKENETNTTGTRRRRKPRNISDKYRTN